MATTDDAPDAESPRRYVYCLVRADDAATLDVTGIAEARVSVVPSDGVAAVTSPAPEDLDADSEAAVKRLLVAHQRVVDAAMERYGAPLPVQAATAIEGEDDAVATWLADRAATVRTTLEDLAEHREYHVTVTWDDDAAREAAHAASDELDDLQRAVDEASPGESYLREKQYERALDEAVAERAADLAADTRSRVAAVAREVVDRERSDAVSFADADDPVTSLAALTALDDEEALGEALDAVADREGVTVRFTGPWAPYSFAPDFDGGES